MDYDAQLLDSIPEESRRLLEQQPLYYDNDARLWREWLPESGQWESSTSESKIRERYFSAPHRRDGLSESEAKTLGKQNMTLLPHIPQPTPEPGFFSLTLWRQHSFAINPLDLGKSHLSREDDHLYDGWVSANLNAHWGNMPILQDPSIDDQISPWFQQLLLSTQGPGNLFLIIGDGGGGSTAAKWLMKAIQELRPWHQNEEVSLVSLEQEERKRGQRILFLDDTPGGNLHSMMDHNLNGNKNILAAYSRDDLDKMGGVPEGSVVLDLGDTSLATSPTNSLGASIWKLNRFSGAHLMSRYMLSHLKGGDVVRGLLEDTSSLGAS